MTFLEVLPKWFGAFLLTQAVEVPIYAVALAGRPWPSRLAIGFGASLVTHPLVWLFCLTFMDRSYEGAVLAAETFAVVAEARWLGSFGVRRGFAWSLVANGASVVFGEAARSLLQFP